MIAANMHSKIWLLILSSSCCIFPYKLHEFGVRSKKQLVYISLSHSVHVYHFWEL